MLVYIKNDGNDTDLQTVDGTVVNFPIQWWW